MADVPDDDVRAAVRERGGDEAGHFLVARIVVPQNELQRIGLDRAHVERGYERVQPLAKLLPANGHSRHGRPNVETRFSILRLKVVHSFDSGGKVMPAIRRLLCVSFALSFVVSLHAAVTGVAINIDGKPVSGEIGRASCRERGEMAE